MQLFNKLRQRGQHQQYQILSSQDAYAQWAASYPATTHNVLMQAEEAGMQEFMPSLAGKTILDLACGSGRWGQWAINHQASQLISIDDSRAMLQQVTTPHVIQGNMTAIPLLDESVDVVLCGLATGHLPPQSMQMAIYEIMRVLKHNGAVLISDFHPVLAWTGAQRTFTAPDGKVYAVEHYIHSMADYFAAATNVGLQLTGIAEPTHPDAPDNKPLALVLRLTKA